MQNLFKRAVPAIGVVALSLVMSGCTLQSEAKKINLDTHYELTNQQIMADAWYQTAAETRALYYQGYNIGTLRLEEALKKGTKKKPAVVLDLDETVLDNSPYQASAVKTGKLFPYNWDKWVQQAEAKALPGAIDFLNRANKSGVDIYYISNRGADQLDATLKNLKMVGAPQAVREHVLLQQPNQPGKEPRRKEVMKDHDILLYFGDNLSDFSGFDHQNVTQRNWNADAMHALFGQKLIVFPNPMYGDWEGALYDYDYSKSDLAKSKLRKDALRYFE
ncbi:5'-nucleotidase, lipoprotein e(P4) family [Priestia koreensis]|uniref:5'-nucleotidase, lipoprotein e(P4) family n=1 Tax=Priestia koreensis TaxID=284581 RepID=UPI00255A152B|nr:5'-nucleotidase, lipoprotein e(P4) family [Priestia koreensis]